MNQKNTILVLLALVFISITGYGQVTFKKTLALDPGEPNSAEQVEECDGAYYVSGKYFNKEIGYWVAYVSEFDLEGNYIKRREIQNDTTWGVGLSDYVFFY